MSGAFDIYTRFPQSGCKDKGYIKGTHGFPKKMSANFVELFGQLYN